MFHLFSMILFSMFILVAIPSYSAEQDSNKHVSVHAISNTNEIKLLIESKPLVLIANKPITIRFRLLKDNKVLRTSDLKEVHTQKIHLLIIDPSLTDYHHVHPHEDTKTGDFVFDFTPKISGSYRMWVDITPLLTNKQEFLSADLGEAAKQNISVKKEQRLISTDGVYQFTLNLDDEPRAGEEVMSTIVVTKNGKPFTQLEPVMGAFAHVVGFSADRSSVLHIHPMGAAPHQTSDRGGSELMFHFEFKKPGFVKLFAQFRIDGKDVYVPFGVFVK